MPESVSWSWEAEDVVQPTTVFGEDVVALQPAVLGGPRLDPYAPGGEVAEARVDVGCGRKGPFLAVLGSHCKGAVGGLGGGLEALEALRPTLSLTALHSRRLRIGGSATPRHRGSMDAPVPTLQPTSHNTAQRCYLHRESHKIR